MLASDISEISDEDLFDFEDEEEEMMDGTEINGKEEETFDFFGLPKPVCDIYHKCGVKNPYDWQKLALSTEGVLDGTRNLVYSLPTSAGKSFVSEILLLRMVLEFNKKALLVLPYVTLVNEKTQFLLQFGRAMEFRVQGFSGGASTNQLCSGPCLMVATIEKASAIVGELLREGRLDELGLIVVDECHIVGEQGRGAILELLMTKAMTFGKNIQMIAMSATVPNVHQLATWLKAEALVIDFRPVSLFEYIKVGNKIKKKGETAWSELKQITSMNGDNDHVFHLCTSTEEQSLIFCATKKKAEEIARKMSSWLQMYRATNKVEVAGFGNQRDRDEVVERWKTTVKNGHQLLGQVLRQGVGFHHAGLAPEEREILEAAYKRGTIRILAATSTLAAGVNLPAGRVIVFPYVVTSFLSVGKYRQMAGRAGRKGLVTEGECFVLPNVKDVQEAEGLLSNPMEPVQSQLALEDDGNNQLKRVVLDVIVALTEQEESADVGSKGQNGCGVSKAKIIEFMRSTLLGIQNPDKAYDERLHEVLVELCNTSEPFLIANAASGLYRASNLGKATAKSMFSLEESLYLYGELMRARQRINLEKNLHLIYLQTPIRSVVATKPDWGRYLDVFSGHIEVIGELLGFYPGYIVNKTRGLGQPSEARVFGIEKTEMNARRLWAARILDKIVSEEPNVESSFLIAGSDDNKGFINNLVQEAIHFSSQMISFCQHLGFAHLEALFQNLDLSNRLGQGVKKELTALLEIKDVGKHRARALWRAGYKTVEQIAAADPDVLESRVGRENLKFTSAQTIIDDSKRVLTDLRRELKIRVRELDGQFGKIKKKIGGAAAAASRRKMGEGKSSIKSRFGGAKKKHVVNGRGRYASYQRQSRDNTEQTRNGNERKRRLDLDQSSIIQREPSPYQEPCKVDDVSKEEEEMAEALLEEAMLMEQMQEKPHVLTLQQPHQPAISQSAAPEQQQQQQQQQQSPPQQQQQSPPQQQQQSPLQQQQQSPPQQQQQSPLQQQQQSPPQQQQSPPQQQQSAQQQQSQQKQQPVALEDIDDDEEITDEMFEQASLIQQELESQQREIEQRIEEMEASINKEEQVRVENAVDNGDAVDDDDEISAEMYEAAMMIQQELQEAQSIKQPLEPIHDSRNPLSEQNDIQRLSQKEESSLPPKANNNNSDNDGNNNNSNSGNNNNSNNNNKENFDDLFDGIDMEIFSQT